MLQTLSLANIHKIDNGRPARAIDAAIRACLVDIEDRPAEEKPRKVVIEIIMRPETMNETGVLESTSVQIQCTPKLPVRHTPEYSMVAMGNNTVGFEAQSPENPRQAPLSDLRETVDPNTGEVKKNG